MPFSSRFFSQVSTLFRPLSPIPQALGHSYLKAVLSKTSSCSHLSFLRSCVRLQLIPKGFQLQFHSPHLLATSSRSIQTTLSSASRRLMSSVIHHLIQKINQTTRTLHHLRSQLTSLCSPSTSSFIINTTRSANEKLHQSLYNTKERKLSALLHAAGRLARPSPSPPTDLSLVHTIPADLPLSLPERQVLARGLNFIPTKPSASKFDALFQVQRYFRRLRLQAHFGSRNCPEPEPPSSHPDLPPFPRQPSSWTPNAGQFSALDFYIDTCLKEIKNLRPKPLTHSNLSPAEITALRTLRSRTDIVIKPADKGGAVVVWQKDLYLAEAHRQLSDSHFYQPSHRPSTKTDNATVRKAIKLAIAKDDLPAEAKCLITAEPKEPRFYLLPKIHKPNTPGRPIVSACSCPTEQISMYLDLILQPIVASLPSYLKDTNHTLQVLQNFSFPSDPSNCFLFTMDVTSLYTSIPHSDGLLALKHFLTEDERSLPVTTLLRLAELVLTLSSFQFGDEHFLQTSGVAMGTRMGPSYACLFMGRLEEQIFQEYTGPVPVLYRRFIDDCFGIATCAKDELLSFIHFVSTFHPAIKFTHEISTTSLPFLDLMISIHPQSTHISTSIHYKPTDSHSYLLFTSNHPSSTKCSIPYSQFLRLRRICTSESDFLSQARIMTTFFEKRGYSKQICHSALEKAHSICRSDALSPAEPNVSPSERPILVLTYHQHNLPVKKILQKHFWMLQSDPALVNIFPQPPLVAYKRDQNLRDQLVSAVFRQPHSNPNQCSGTSPCGQPRCDSCPHVHQSAAITGPSGRFHIHKQFNCLSTDVVYVITCAYCHQLYVGETYRTLCERVSEHLRAVRLFYPTPVGIHFNLPNHSVSDVRVTAVWQNTSYSFLRRKFMESYIIQRLGSLQPLGINIRL